MINQDNYYEDKSHITNSMLGWLNESPAYFKSQIESQSTSTEPMIFGSAFHCKVLEPEKFDDLYYIIPKIDKRTKAGKEAFAEHLLNAGNKIILTTEQYSKILGMEEAVNNNETMKELFSCNKAVKESVNVWTESIRDDNDETHIIKCKSLIDLRRDADDLVVDLKTTASVKAFTSSIKKFGYDRQAAYYLRGLIANKLVSPNARFVFGVVEKQPPFEIAMFELDASVMEVANEKIDHLLGIYQKCLSEDCYPKRYERFDGKLNLVTLTAEDLY